MQLHEVTVIDYGVGNLLSVRHAFEHCGAKVEVTSDEEVIRRASHVILPGVGAFGDGMAQLRRHGLDSVVHEVVSRGHYLLGICLGMQMLFDESEEFGLNAGLGLIPGRVIPVPKFSVDGQAQKVPHIGWNELVHPAGEEAWKGNLMRQITPGDAMYFVHSYMAMPAAASDRVADCLYGGHRVAAVVGHGNVIGCQFHPEKSGAMGIKILENFLTL